MILIRKTHLLALALGLVSLFYLLIHADYIILPGSRGPEHTIGPLYDTTIFNPGTPKPSGEPYTRTLVMGRLESEDVSWITEELPDVDTAIYIVDAANTTTTLPANKGHEAMVYLTYIIDHYPVFPDVVLFMHPHRTAWHNNILLDISGVSTIKSISPAHVVRQGYFNTRCHLDPGCPNWLHVDRLPWRYDHKHKPEEPYLTSALFHELHGADVPLPKALSQPCCAQFAVSGARIAARPKEMYMHYRDWLLTTPLSDSTSGRLLEYSWQYIFSGLWEFCPAQHQCYCDGYGICFGGEAGLDYWLKVLRSKEKVDGKLAQLWDDGKQGSEWYRVLSEKSNEITRELGQLKDEAVERGRDPRERARECGRAWTEGDGY